MECFYIVILMPSNAFYIFGNEKNFTITSRTSITIKCNSNPIFSVIISQQLNNEYYNLIR